MIDIDLHNIILERKFGPVAIGSKIKSVIEILGEPDDQGAFDTNNHYLRYGWFEFFFVDKKLDSFQNKKALNKFYQFSDDFHFSNSKFKVSTRFLNKQEGLKIKYFRKWLDEAGVQYTKKAFWDSLKLIIKDDIEIMFYNKNLEDKVIKSQSELIHDQRVYEDDDNWIFAGFYVLGSKSHNTR